MWKSSNRMEISFLYCCISNGHFTEFFVCRSFFALQKDPSWRSWYIIKLCIIFFQLSLYIRKREKEREREREIKWNELKHLNKWRKLSLGLCIFPPDGCARAETFRLRMLFSLFGPSLSTRIKWFFRSDFFLLCFHFSFKQNRHFTVSFLGLRRKKCFLFRLKFFLTKSVMCLSHLIIIKSLLNTKWICLLAQFLLD